jgi:putative peptide zinc metalloprotease protein
LRAEWLCPDLSQHWQLRSGRSKRNPAQASVQKAYYLVALEQPQVKILLSTPEAQTLKYFTGDRTLEEVQVLCERELEDIPADWVMQVVQKLVDHGAVQIHPNQAIDPPKQPNHQPSGALKPTVQWLPHPDRPEDWLLRNPDNLEQIELGAEVRPLVEQLGYRSLADLAIDHDIDLQELRALYGGLAQSEMLVDVPKPVPRKRKWTPMKLMSFRRPLFNPDPWLNRHCHRLIWMRSPWFGWALAFALAGSFAVMLDRLPAILNEGQALWQFWGSSLLLPFVLLVALVITIHEFGHAFTLKAYGGTVPTIGLLFMMFIPVAYTDSNDAYPLPQHQRAMVFGAGILVQAALTAIGFWAWLLSGDGTWLHTASYLLMAAATFTLAINFNPLASYDGYYLLTALTGINNLRPQSFQFYKALFQGKPSPATPRDRPILAVYAPFALAYSLLVMGSIFMLVVYWCLTHAPMLSATALGLWLLYFCFWPDPSK